jgi:hypothetical protein
MQFNPQPKKEITNIIRYKAVFIIPLPTADRRLLTVVACRLQTVDC